MGWLVTLWAGWSPWLTMPPPEQYWASDVSAWPGRSATTSAAEASRGSHSEDLGRRMGSPQRQPLRQHGSAQSRTPRAPEPVGAFPQSSPNWIDLLQLPRGFDQLVPVQRARLVEQLQDLVGNVRTQRVLASRNLAVAATGSATVSVQRAEGPKSAKSAPKPKGKGPVATLPLTVGKDPAEPRRLTFSRPVTREGAVAFLWEGRFAPSAEAFKPDPAERVTNGPQTRFLWDTDDFDAFFALRPEVRRMYAPKLLMAKGPPRLPAWVPPEIRESLLSGRHPSGIHRYPGTPPWGDLVVWVSSGALYHVEVYQEFPDSLDFYVDAARGDKRIGRILRDAYTQYNRDMRYFVEERGLTPEMARGEIRRINEEVFKLVLEAAAAMLTSGASVSAVRRTADSVADAAERTGFKKSYGATTKGKPTAGGPKPTTGPVAAIDAAKAELAAVRASGKTVVVNLGGTGEVAGAINVNNLTSGAVKGIPKLVKANAEDVATLFPPGSLDKIVANRMPANTVNWNTVARGAYKTLKPGGQVSLNEYGGPESAAKIADALRKAGFKDVKTIGGVLVEAVKP